MSHRRRSALRALSLAAVVVGVLRPGERELRALDTSRGPTYRANPNLLTATRTSITIPRAPVARAVTITPALVDGVVGTAAEEYPLGPVGVALDSVLLFNPLARPGDDIEEEKLTFDRYDAHPTANGAYHYHTTSPGPLEVLSSLGIGSVEMLLAIDPRHAFAFFVHNRLHGFLVLGSVFLVVTGGEALYADMGHFGRGPIRVG